MTSISNVFNTLTLCHDIRQMCSKSTVTGKLIGIRSTLTSSTNSPSSLKQQSAGRHVTPLGHIILIPSQPIFALSH
jgi:hypothetical protein